MPLSGSQSGYINHALLLAREEAIDIFRAQAEREGLVITVCAWCKKFMSKVAGEGEAGLSHGCCEDCVERVRTEAGIQ